MAVTNVGRVKGSLIYSGPAATDAAIKLEVTAPLDGDVYISTGASNYCFQYKGTSSTWVQKTSLKGIKGDTGAVGMPGMPGMPGDSGTAAGFGAPTATVDALVGTPSVTITPSGTNTAKVFNFAFKNLKGAPGATGPQGVPGPVGMKGDTGLTGAQGIPGVKGDTGSMGPRGEQGVAGSHGQDGHSPVVTSSMNAKGELILDIT